MKWIKASEIDKLRNSLYDQLPTGEVHAFEYVKLISSHIKALDKLVEESPDAVSTTHEKAMQDDFGVPNHVKIDGQPVGDKEAILSSLGGHDATHIGHEVYFKSKVLAAMDEYAASRKTDFQIAWELSQTKDKPFFIDTFRKLLRLYDKEEISLSKFVEELNIAAYKWHESYAASQGKDREVQGVTDSPNIHISANDSEDKNVATEMVFHKMADGTLFCEVYPHDDKRKYYDHDQFTFDAAAKQNLIDFLNSKTTY